MEWLARHIISYRHSAAESTGAGEREGSCAERPVRLVGHEAIPEPSGNSPSGLIVVCTAVDNPITPPAAMTSWVSAPRCAQVRPQRQWQA